jgi:hypothetical protein
MAGQFNEGSPALPVSKDVPAMQGGMSLRDWFASQALPAMLAKNSKLYPKLSYFELAEISAEESYYVADAMIIQSEEE